MENTQAINLLARHAHLRHTKARGRAYLTRIGLDASAKYLRKRKLVVLMILLSGLALWGGARALTARNAIGNGHDESTCAKGGACGSYHRDWHHGVAHVPSLLAAPFLGNGHDGQKYLPKRGSLWFLLSGSWGGARALTAGSTIGKGHDGTSSLQYHASSRCLISPAEAI